MFKRTLLLLCCVFVFFFSGSTLCECSQPESGPGGSDYAHEGYTQKKELRGSKSYYVFIPDEPELSSPAPTIVFLHGLYGTMPSCYIGWISHIVRKGNVVIFPVYQSMLDGISSNKFLQNTLSALNDALGKYSDVIDTERMAIVGHSAGGLLTANLLAVAEEEGLPHFKAGMCVAPGKTPIFRFEDLTQIPEDTYLLSVAGDSDLLVGQKDAKTIFNRTEQIINRNYILIRTDLPVLAYHFAPLSLTGEFLITEIDYYGYWKLFEALCDAAFYDDLNREYCLDDTPEQRYMGEKNNGTPFKEMEVTLP